MAIWVVFALSLVCSRGGRDLYHVTEVLGRHDAKQVGRYPHLTLLSTRACRVQTRDRVEL